MALLKKISWNGKSITDITGKVFNYLTVVAFDYERMDRRLADGKSYNEYWLCKCDCGNERLKSIRSSDLYADKVKSCGCLSRRRKYDVDIRLMKIYSDMKRRCYNPNCSLYKYYGEKGVTICNAWLKDPIAFYDWALSHGYDSELTIDRKNAHGNYTPRNCRWATKKQQARNKRETVFITISGKKHSLIEWAEISEITEEEIYNRLKLGWNIKDACTVKNEEKYPLN